MFQQDSDIESCGFCLIFTHVPMFNDAQITSKKKKMLGTKEIMYYAPLSKVNEKETCNFLHKMNTE